MTGLILQSAAEVNNMLKEITEFTVRGLIEPDIRVKQFYLERIYLSLGMNLREVRERFKQFDIEIGVNPDER